MAWTSDDLGSVACDFKTLAIAGNGVVAGALSVCGAMSGGSLILNPTVDHLADGEVQATFLVDTFKVEIGFGEHGPYLRVLGTRLQETAQRFGKELIDLHVYKDQSACFAAPQQLWSDAASGMTPTEFIWHYVQPFLYEQAYFDRHGLWPWGELAHGAIGLIEWLARAPKRTDGDVFRTILCIDAAGDCAKALIQSRARWHHRCPCGSGKRVRTCHPEYKLGVDMIRSWIAQGNSPKHRKLIRSPEPH